MRLIQQAYQPEEKTSTLQTMKAFPRNPVESFSDEVHGSIMTLYAAEL